MPEKNKSSQADSTQPNNSTPDLSSAKASKMNTTTSSLDENQVAYGELREENRLVMSHEIALNIDNFRAASDGFEVNPVQNFPELKVQKPPFASIIIPNQNGQHFLDALFGSLQKQTFQDFEVIFVDDASTDNSISYLEEKFGDHLDEGPLDRGSLDGVPLDDGQVAGNLKFQLRLIASSTNQGFAVSCNKGASIARGRVFIMLNNDTEPEEKWLEELVKTICANPTAAIVTSKILLFDKRDHLHTTGDMLGRNGIPYNRGVWQKDQGQFDDQPAVFSGCGGGSAYRRDVWEMLGGFDEDFWMYLEDVDYAFRAQLTGWEAILAPDARVYHHLSATSGHTLASYQVGRNTIWTIVKNMPRSLLIRNLPAIILAQLKITLDAFQNIRGEAAQARLKGQLDSLLGLPRQLHKRQVIQQRRILEDSALEKKLG